MGSELPHVRWLVGGKFGYQNLFDAIGLNIRWVWIRGVITDFSNSDFVIGLLPLLGALVGLVTAPRRAVRLFGLAFFSMGLYALFILLYWHFEGRYFQVLIPWCYLLLAGALVWLADVVGAVWRGRSGKIRRHGANPPSLIVGPSTPRSTKPTESPASKICTRR